MEGLAKTDKLLKIILFSAVFELMFKQIQENSSSLLMVSHDTSLSSYFDRVIDINDILMRGD